MRLVQFIRSSSRKNSENYLRRSVCTFDRRQGKIDITCDALDDGQIDWDCIFGPESLEEVHDRGGTFTTCTSPNSKRPCSRYDSIAVWHSVVVLSSSYYCIIIITLLYY